MNAHKIDQRLELARELADKVLRNISRVEYGNGELVALLDNDPEGNGTVFDPLPGADLEAVHANIAHALELASQPVPAITTGRNRDGKMRAAEYQRRELRLLCRVALVLTEPTPTADSSDAAAKLAAIRAILEGGAA